MSSDNLVEQRIAEWTEVCRRRRPPLALTDLRTPLEIFEQQVRDMRHAGYALPYAVVAGVRKNLKGEG